MQCYILKIGSIHYHAERRRLRKVVISFLVAHMLEDIFLLGMPHIIIDTSWLLYYLWLLYDKTMKNAEISMRPQTSDAWIMFFTDYPRVLGYLVDPMRQVVISGLDYVYKYID